MEYEDTWEYGDCLQTSQSPLLKDVYFRCMNNFCLALANNGFCSWPSIQLTNPEVKPEKQNVNEKAAHQKKTKKTHPPEETTVASRWAPCFEQNPWCFGLFTLLEHFLFLEISHSLLDANFPFLICSLKCLMTALTSFVVHGLRFGQQFLLVWPEKRDKKFRLKIKHAEF